MSENKKVFILFTVLTMVLVLVFVFIGIKGDERQKRQESALESIVCLSSCNSYSAGCRDACGEDAACQERCHMKWRTCTNGCGLRP